MPLGLGREGERERERDGDRGRERKRERDRRKQAGRWFCSRLPSSCRLFRTGPRASQTALKVPSHVHGSQEAVGREREREREREACKARELDVESHREPKCRVVHEKKAGICSLDMQCLCQDSGHASRTSHFQLSVSRSVPEPPPSPQQRHQGLTRPRRGSQVMPSSSCCQEQKAAIKDHRKAMLA